MASEEELFTITVGSNGKFAIVSKEDKDKFLEALPVLKSYDLMVPSWNWYEHFGIDRTDYAVLKSMAVHKAIPAEEDRKRMHLLIEQMGGGSPELTETLNRRKDSPGKRSRTTFETFKSYFCDEEGLANTLETLKDFEQKLRTCMGREECDKWIAELARQRDYFKGGVTALLLWKLGTAAPSKKVASSSAAVTNLHT